MWSGEQEKRKSFNTIVPDHMSKIIFVSVINPSMLRRKDNLYGFIYL
jgi:hypothetical protein